jgi:hypothetical protein
VGSHMFQHVSRRLNGILTNLFMLIASPQSSQTMKVPPVPPAILRVVMYMP